MNACNLPLIVGLQLFQEFAKNEITQKKPTIKTKKRVLKLKFQDSFERYLQY